MDTAQLVGAEAHTGDAPAGGNIQIAGAGAENGVSLQIFAEDRPDLLVDAALAGFIHGLGYQVLENHRDMTRGG